MHQIRRLEYPGYAEFRCGLSYMVANPILGDAHAPWLLIDDLEVRPVRRRRQGIGTALVREALPYAREIGASRILAGIVSREALVVMTNVFGADAIDVTTEGDFGLRTVTKAFLDYKL